MIPQQLSPAQAMIPQQLKPQSPSLMIPRQLNPPLIPQQQLLPESSLTQQQRNGLGVGPHCYAAPAHFSDEPANRHAAVLVAAGNDSIVRVTLSTHGGKQRARMAASSCPTDWGGSAQANPSACVVSCVCPPKQTSTLIALDSSSAALGIGISVGGDVASETQPDDCDGEAVAPESQPNNAEGETAAAVTVPQGSGPSSRRDMVYAKIDPVLAGWTERLYLERGFMIAEAAWLDGMKAPTLGSRVGSLMKSGVKRVIPEVDTMRAQVIHQMKRMKAAAEDVLFFSTSDKETLEKSLAKLLTILSRVEYSLDICNWNISYEDLVELVLRAKKRDIVVRVVTDSTQAEQDCFKIQELVDAGVTDNIMGNTAWSMHHKFCILDDVTVLNGTFNWSRRAVFKNMENVVVTSSDKLLRKFKKEFARVIGLNFNQFPGDKKKKASQAKEKKKK